MDNVMQYDIPVVILSFLRTDAPLKTIDILRKIRAKTVILFSDGPRNSSENEKIKVVRDTLIKAIDWDAQIVTHFQDKNVGIFESIGLGAIWVFERYNYAIFLEDDNIPDYTFFEYCREMLIKYEHDERIFWICGGNYLEKYSPKDGSDIVFTKHMIPSGWASWSSKFIKFYDKDLILPRNKQMRKKVRKSYLQKSLYKQQIRSIGREMYRQDHGMPFISWDFHTIFSVRGNDMYGISPRVNLIGNCGIDDVAGHNSAKGFHPNATRITQLIKYPLSFPLTLPNDIHIDEEYEKRVGKFILSPLFVRLLYPVTNTLKKMFGLYPNGDLINIFSKSNKKTKS